MIIYALLGVGCLLTMTWVVVRTIRDQGEQTRAAMEQIADSAVTNGIGQAIDAATDAPKDLVGTMSERSQHLTNELGDTATEILGEMRAILRERDEKSESGEPQKASSPTLPNGQPLPASGTKRSAPGSLIGELFRTGQEVAKSLDQIGQEVLKLDPAEERQLGEGLNRLICNQHEILNEPRIPDRLATLAAPFLKRRKRPEIDYTFVVVDDPEVNAFAHAGGYVYVHRGLLEFVSDDEELRFVLGHEIAHIDLGHCVERMTYASRVSQGAGELGGSLVQIAYHAIALGYSEDKEFEADAWAYAGLGDSRPGALRFFERLAEREDEPKIERSDDTVLDVTVQEVENHFRTHPATIERLKRLRELKTADNLP